MKEIITPYQYGQLSQNGIEEFEKQFRIKFPSDYHDFLLLYNGGTPSPSYFWIVPNKDGTGVNQFFGIFSYPEHLSLSTYINSRKFGIPESMLAIGDDGLGNFICLGISHNIFGKVFFLDHDKHPYHDPNSSDGLTEIAKSFTEFLHSLKDILE